MSENEMISLDTLGDGAAIEKFNEALKKVAANVADPNTQAKTKRSITIKVDFAPGEDRNVGAYSIQVSEKLAPVKDTGGVVYFGRAGGRDLVVERNLRQLDLPGADVADISQRKAAQ